MTERRIRLIALAILVLFAAASRLIPHPPNFTAIAAVALFGGATFSDRRLAITIPVLALVASDWLLGLHRLAPLVYLLFGLTAVLGLFLRGRRGFLPVTSAALASATLFFLVTNAAVWAGSRIYPQSIEGLFACYVAALPFFGNGIAGNLFYSALLFGGWALAERGFPALRPAGAQA